MSLHYTLSRSADLFFFFLQQEFLKEGRVCRLDSGASSLNCTVPGHTEFVETVEAMSSVGSFLSQME